MLLEKFESWKNCLEIYKRQDLVIKSILETIESDFLRSGVVNIVDDNRSP